MPWPAGTEDSWRCEIAWNAGYRTSRFEVVVRAPGRRRGQVAAQSEPFRWLLNGLPDPRRPEFPAAVRSLTATLVAVGWKPIQPGAAWYARRFVWPGAEPPPALHYTS